MIFESHGRLAHQVVWVELPLTPHPWEGREAMQRPSVRRGVWEKQRRYRKARRAPQRSYSPEDPVEMISATGEADPWRHFADLNVPASVLSSSCRTLTPGAPHNLTPVRFCLFYLSFLPAPPRIGVSVGWRPRPGAALARVEGLRDSRAGVG